jgi:hypothetical protein
MKLYSLLAECEDVLGQLFSTPIIFTDNPDRVDDALLQVGISPTNPNFISNYRCDDKKVWWELNKLDANVAEKLMNRIRAAHPHHRIPLQWRTARIRIDLIALAPKEVA